MAVPRENNLEGEKINANTQNRQQIYTWGFAFGNIGCWWRCGSLLKECRATSWQGEVGDGMKWTTRAWRSNRTVGWRRWGRGGGVVTAALADGCTPASWPAPVPTPRPSTGAATGHTPSITIRGGHRGPPLPLGPVAQPRGRWTGALPGVPVEGQIWVAPLPSLTLHLDFCWNKGQILSKLHSKSLHFPLSWKPSHGTVLPIYDYT